MRTLITLFSSKHSTMTHLRRNSLLPLLLPLARTPSSPITPPSIPPPLPAHRTLHGVPATPDPFTPPPSRILQSNPSPVPESEDDDGPMNEFLSRFVWGIRGKLSEAYPGVGRDTLEGMLLVICQKVVDEMDRPGGAPPAGDPAVDLSPDLWKTIWEVSNSVHEAMRRDGVREEMRNYLHSDEVKEMCRFAGDVGIRGNLLRELRFKWAREKLEEVEFYRSLERMREQAGMEEEAEKAPGGVSEVGGSDEALAGEVVEKGGRPTTVVTALPQRRGKIKYKIYGLDLSDPKWAEVAQRVEEAEKHIVPEEPQPIVGRCKKIDDKILALNAEKDDPSAALAEWSEILQPKRVDWLALLRRIMERNLDLYFKVAELLLNEESFDTNIRDYSKLIDAHSKLDCIEDAERILEKMSERGIVPDVLISIILLHMYSKVGNLDRAKDAFESLRNQAFQPDLKIYNSMITAYLKAGLPKEGETLIGEMELKDIKPTTETFMAVLRAYAERGQVDGAQRIVNRMQFAGIQPSLESCTLLVEAYAQAGNPDKARGHFDHMMKMGHKPDDRCTASMMAVYMSKNLLDKALNLLLSLEKDGFQPGVATYTILVDWFGMLQLVDEAERLLSIIREKGQPPFEVHISLCNMYSKARQEDKARKYLRVLEGRKEVLRADQFERIVNGLLTGGLVEDAKRMYDVMQARGFSPSDPTKVAIMAAQATRHQKPATRRVGRV